MPLLVERPRPETLVRLLVERRRPVVLAHSPAEEPPPVILAHRLMEEHPPAILMHSPRARRQAMSQFREGLRKAGEPKMPKPLHGQRKLSNS